MKSKLCVLLVVIIIAVMLMTATTAMATRYFEVVSVEGDLNLEGSCTFHLHGKRTTFDGPNLTLSFSKSQKDLIKYLEAEMRTGSSSLLSRPKDGVDYSFEWRMYKDDLECVIHLKSPDNFGVAENDPTQTVPVYDPTQPFTVTFTNVEFVLVELVSSEKKHPKKDDKTIGPSEWKTVGTVWLTFTITLEEEL